MQKAQILYVSDHFQRRQWVSERLSEAALNVRIAASGKSALKMAFCHKPDLILIDYALPDMDGAEVVGDLRCIHSTRRVPAIMLAETHDEDVLVRCFSMGIDDFIRVPFSVMELIARIRAQLRRAESRRKSEAILRVGPITINRESYSVDCDGRALPLTHMEFELLNALALYSGATLSRDYLLEHIWGYNYNGQTRTVDAHIRSIRAKLKDNAGMIRTVPGEGYTLRSMRRTG